MLANRRMSLIGFSLLFCFSGCETPEEPTDPADPTREATYAAPAVKAAANAFNALWGAMRAKAWLDHLSVNNIQKGQARAEAMGAFKSLAALVHPQKGVRFSPYAHVDLSRDLVFAADQLSGMATSNERYHWGSYDGSGNPMELSFNDYLMKFVCKVDYRKSELILEDGTTEKINITISREPTAGGNTINNIKESYPNGAYVVYSSSGSSLGFEMDWSKLTFVFEKGSNNKLYLVGIAHDEWTI
jgi:hypothetical protein